MNIPQVFASEFNELFFREKVIFAYLFGSQVKKETGTLSDIDLGVYFDEQLTKSEMFNRKLKILFEISMFFKKDDVDLVILNDVYPLLGHRIIKEGIVVFSMDEKKRLDFEHKIITAYLDFKPFLEKYVKEVIYGR